MKKLLFLLLIWLYPLLSNGAINEYLTDVYYANGMQVDEGNATVSTTLLRNVILEQYGGETEMKKHIGKVKEAYNSTHGLFPDLLESAMQKFDLQLLIDWYALLKGYITSHLENSRDQINAYKSSIMNGRKVLVVAHSQGNLFTGEAYLALGKESKNGWMQGYFEAVSVASPREADIKEDTERIDWDNDPVSRIATRGKKSSLMTVDPTRKVNWESEPYIGEAVVMPSVNYVDILQLNKMYKERYKAVEDGLDFSFNVHAFIYYMGECLSGCKNPILNPFDDKPLQTNDAKIKIMKAIKKKLDDLEKVKSQWRTVKNTGCTCQEKRIQVTHQYDPRLDYLIPHSKGDASRYYDYGNLLDFNSQGKIYNVSMIGGAWTYVRASQGGVIMKNQANSPCYILNSQGGGDVIGDISGPKECNQDPEDPDPEDPTDPTDPDITDPTDNNNTDPSDNNTTDPTDNNTTDHEDNNITDPSDNNNTSPDDNTTKPPPDCNSSGDGFLPDGLFTATLGWSNHYVNFDMKNGLMPHKMQGCGYVSLSSGDLELEDVYPRIYPITVSPSEQDKLDENVSDTVFFEVKAVDTFKSASFPIAKNYDYSKLGHLADIVITQPDDPLARPRMEIVSTGYGGQSSRNFIYFAGTGSAAGGSTTIPVSHDDPPLCETTDCACVPCEYSIVLQLNQSRLGPISGATVRLYKATQEDESNRTILYSGNTSISNEIDKAGIINLPVTHPQQTTFTQAEQSLIDAIADYEGDFILEVSGGVDIDRDDDFTVDSSFTQVNGKLHLILTKERLLQNDYKVNILTEIGYQLSKDLLGENYDKVRLQARLDDIAKRVLIEKLYPDAMQPLGRDDLFYWIPMAHKNWLVKPYDATLAPIVDKVYAGENIYDEAYNYVYGPLSDLLATIPILKSQWFKVDENVTGGTLIGEVTLTSKGSSSVTDYKISGDGSQIFRVESDGKVYLEDNATLDYETTALYQMQLHASNDTSESRPVTLYITLNNISDAPEDRSFSGGVIAEDASEGDVAGVMTFAEGASPIERIEIGGANASDFTVDLNGTIHVSGTADFDYETHKSARITLQAFNSLGGSRVIPIRFVITDAVDMPIVQMLDVHLDENASSGTVVGKVKLLSNDPLLSVKLLGDGANNFSIDLNGTLNIAIGAHLDYETRANYVLQVEASNIQGTGRLGTVVIRLNNIADVPQLKRTVLHVLEGSIEGTSVGNVNVENNGSSSILNFNLVGTGSEYFSIDVSGNITVNNAALSHSTQAFFNLYATASNSEGISLRSTVVIYIDTQRPILGILDSWVHEDTEVDTVVGTVPVASTGSAITAMRLEGIGAENFTIDTQAKVSVASGTNLDYETTTRYNLRVFAVNSAGESDGMPLYIRVVDRSDTLKIKGFSTTMYEDVSVGTTVGFVSVVSYGGKTTDHYELTGIGSEKFTILNDGKMQVALNAIFDSSQISKYHLAIVVVDTDGARSNQVFVDISVVESINIIPQISDLSLMVQEDASVGSTVGRTTLVSKTKVIEQTWLVGEESDVFEMKADGAIVLKQNLDYELKKSYSFMMYARNSLGQSQAASLSINITNIIDDEPVLNSTNFSLLENTTVGTILGTVEVNSTGISAVTSMTLTGIGSEKFSIDSNGTVKLVETVDYENKKVYHLRAIASNTKANSPEVDVTVEVLNIAEHVPVLYTFKGYVEDNATAGTAIGDVAFASRGDSSVNGFVLSGTGDENFTIDANGTIRVSNKSSLNENTQKVYTLSLVATNEAGESKSADILITLTYDKTIPYRPNNLELLDIGHNSITLGWVDNAQNERGFNLYKDGVKLLTLDANTTSYRITGLAEESTYFFTLKSFNDRGESQGLSIVGITDIDRSEYLKAVLDQKCGISETTFDANFNVDTGYYNGTINCSYKGLTDEDLLNFKALKEVKYYFYLNHNKLTNVNGLINLKKVGRNFYLHNNQLTNVDGLSKLESVGWELHLESNQLSNVNGLSHLTSVGSHFYLQSNQLTNLNGLSLLRSVGSNLNIEGNQLTNLDGLSNLTTLGGDLALRGNSDLTDISGVSNTKGKSSKLLYINPGQYITKASEGSNLCSTTWDLRDSNGNIADDMTQVCDSQEPYAPSKSDEFRDILGEKCNISSSAFYANFNSDTGYYNGTINCSYKALTDEDLLNFKVLKEVKYYFYLNHNKLTNIDGLSNLKRVGRHLYLHNNQLTNVDGLNKLESVGWEFHLETNQLGNVNGLSHLTSVGSHFYLQNNQLGHLDGLLSLAKVGNNLNVEGNGLTKLNGLSSLTNLGGYLALRGNTNLTDISGVSNAQGSNGQILYLDPGQYTNKVKESSNFCSTIWDLRDRNGNIADDMTQVCDSQEPYAPSGLDKLRDTLGEKCNISSSAFYTNFNVDTGYYNGTVNCSYKGLTDEDLLNFKALKEVKYYFYLNHNKLTNIDALVNLKKVGRNFYLHNNQLTNVDGLNKLESVGWELHLESNQLSNVNGLSHLTSVGSHFYLHSNQLDNVDGLSSLASVGNNFNMEGNRLTNLNALSKLTTLGGYLGLRGNLNLTDISGVSNAQGSNGQIFYMDIEQYTTKVSRGSNFCSTVWDLRDANGNIADDMPLVCDMNSTELTDEDKLRNVLGEKCAIDSSAFYNNFNADTGYYNGTINCSYKGLTDEDLLNFKALKEVKYYFYLNHNKLTNVNGLINLKKVGRHFYLHNNQLVNIDGLNKLESVEWEFHLEENKLTNVNGLSHLASVGSHFYLHNNQLTNLNGLSVLISVGSNFNVEGNKLLELDGLSKLTTLGGDLALRGNSNLTDISGLSNVQGNSAKLLYINTGQYTAKANENLNFCSTAWDLRDPSGNIADDMTQVCDSQDPYAPSELDKFRDFLGEKCNISSSAFYSNFNAETGYYNGSISCASQSLSSEELLHFKVLKELKSDFHLYNNQLTDLDGLSNLERVGRHFYLYNNQLTNVDGLNNLKSVGSYFYLQSNQLTNLNGLSSLVSAGNNFNLEGNDLSNLDGLNNLTNLGGYLALRGNAGLVDISGVSNVQGSDGQILYVNPGQYKVKANENLKFCSSTWDLRDANGDIDDNMTQVCGEGVALTETQKLRAVMEAKCSVSFSQFSNNFDEDTGIYNGSLDCAHNQMNNDDIGQFTLLNEITGSFSIDNNSLTKLDGLSNLTSIGGYFYLQKNQITDFSALSALTNVQGALDASYNQVFNLDAFYDLTTVSGDLKIYNNVNLTDIAGISNIIGIDGKKIYLDSADYSTKAELDGELCSAIWDLYDTTGNIPDDMSRLCDGYNYLPTNAGRLRDLLGKRCSIDSSVFYNSFAEDSGIYNGDIKCQSIVDGEMTDFAGLFEVHGSFAIEESTITTLDELIRLKNVTGTLSIWHNPDLRDIDGISNILGVDNQKLMIDDTDQYDIKADNTKGFCATSWDIYDGASNIVNDMNKVCNE